MPPSMHLHTEIYPNLAQDRCLSREAADVVGRSRIESSSQVGMFLNILICRFIVVDHVLHCKRQIVLLLLYTNFIFRLSSSAYMGRCMGGGGGEHFISLIRGCQLMRILAYFNIYYFFF